MKDVNIDKDYESNQYPELLSPEIKYDDRPYGSEQKKNNDNIGIQ